MKDEDYEEHQRIYYPTPGFEIRTTPMQINNKHNPSVFQNKNNPRHFHSLFATFGYCVRMPATHSIYVYAEMNARLSLCV